jgi:hypothetical protein
MYERFASRPDVQCAVHVHHLMCTSCLHSNSRCDALSAAQVESRTSLLATAPALLCTYQIISHVTRA